MIDIALAHNGTQLVNFLLSNTPLAIFENFTKGPLPLHCLAILRSGSGATLHRV
jgi:hypothetical protein